MATMTTIPSTAEKRWQCVSGFRERGADRAEAHEILQSTLTVCRQMPVGMTPEKAAQQLYPAGYARYTRWEMQTPAAGATR
jgi:hypothetical protein